MKNAEKIMQAFTAKLGEGKQFSSENALAQYLGLGNTKHTKLYAFLAGSDTRYKSVCDWLDIMGWSINTGNVGDICSDGDLEKLQSENAELRKEISDLRSQLKFAEKILCAHVKGKAPAQEASSKEQKSLPLSGTEGE